ncbi:MAG: hypothetical protein QXM68_03545 [Candidatus Aenigmatarchaeota archaeon]|nr:hypothetical protein [Candidatus Aenigmarchaeota archaeon]
MKGLSLMLSLILALVILGIGLLVFNKIKNWRCFGNIFECGESAKLILSANCVYTRCLKGCNDKDTISLQTNDFNCQNTCDKASFLDLVKSDSSIVFDYSYCGLQYPIPVDLTNEAESRRKISLKDFKTFDCIVLYNDRADNTFDDVFNDNPFPSMNVIFIDGSIVENYEELKSGNCVTGLPIESKYKQIDNVVIKSGIIYSYGGADNFIVSVSYPSASVKQLDGTKIFLSDIYYYNQFNSNSIAFIPGRYYPLDATNGIVFAIQSVSLSQCSSLKYYYHCGNQVQSGSIDHPELPVDFQICNKYRFYADSACISNQNAPIVLNAERI